MPVDACSLSTPALLAFLLLPSVLGMGTIATASRLARTSSTGFSLKLAALQTAPLTAGSLGSLVLLRQPSAGLVLAIGALAILPLLATLYAAHHPLAVKTATSRTAMENSEGPAHLCNGHARKGMSRRVLPVGPCFRQKSCETPLSIATVRLVTMCAARILR